MKLSKILFLMVGIVMVLGFIGCTMSSTTEDDSYGVKVPVFDVTADNFSKSYSVKSIIDVSGNTDYDEFMTGSLMLGPAVRSFETQLTTDGQTEFSVDMPKDETAQFIKSGDTFSYGPDGDKTEITINTSSNTEETVMLSFITESGLFTIYKATTFSGDITQDEFHVSFTGKGYLKGPFQDENDIDTDGDTDELLIMTNAGIFTGEIARTSTKFALLMTETDGMVGYKDGSIDISTLSLDDPIFTTFTQVPANVLYYFDGASYFTYYDVNDINNALKEIDPDWQI